MRCIWGSYLQSRDVFSNILCQQFTQTTAVSSPSMADFRIFEILIFSIIIFNRPGVSRGCSTISLVTHSFSQPFSPNLQNIINHKPEELGSWNFGRMFTPHNMSHVTCRMAHVTCHMSRVTCNFFLTKWWSSSVEGLLSTGPTPSSLYRLYVTILTYEWTLINLCTQQASCRHAAGQAKI